MGDLSIKIRDLCSSLNSIADEVQKIEDRINHLEIEQSQDNMMMKNIAEAINNYRANNMPTPFDIRQKFLTGEYTEKDLDEAVRLRWISADQALKFIKHKAHIKMDDLYDKHKNISIINFNTDKEDNEK